MKLIGRSKFLYHTISNKGRLKSKINKNSEYFFQTDKIFGGRLSSSFVFCVSFEDANRKKINKITKNSTPQQTLYLVKPLFENVFNGM
ncbi:hypothetical protein [Chryseobacterium sp.]|jgi:hypothetical protein|uniref:hypothetical protein n=1 Tax=Chryseobacterium sp. TaxID=1871047 RepID=UPI002604AABC|nr:hypothetical protein [Chryseobacterium sp.]